MIKYNHVSVCTCACKGMSLVSLIILLLAVVIVLGYLRFQLYGYLRFLCFVEFQENEKTANRN